MLFGPCRFPTRYYIILDIKNTSEAHAFQETNLEMLVVKSRTLQPIGYPK